MTDYGFPFASLENEFLRLDYLTTTGPRIVGLYIRSAKDNLLAETPEVHWETPHGEYYLRGGHRLWTAPEDLYYTCPEEGLSVIEGDGVTLRSPVEASLLEREIKIRLLDANRVHLSHRVTWHGEQPMEFSPWAITQLRLGGLAILPLSESEGLQPNRNLVFWSYSQIHDERLELHDDLILLHGRADRRAFKIGNRNTLGWVACALGNALFVKRFLSDPKGRYPDMGCNVEAYVKDTCLELETLGPLVTLRRGESVSHEESWEIYAGEYPPTPERARSIKEQWSQPQ